MLLALVEAGKDRHEGYRLVQRHAHAAWDDLSREAVSFRRALETDPDVVSRLSPDQLDHLFNPSIQLRHVDDVFARLGLLDRVPQEASEREAVPA